MNESDNNKKLYDDNIEYTFFKSFKIKSILKTKPILMRSYKIPNTIIKQTTRKIRKPPDSLRKVI